MPRSRISCQIRRSCTRLETVKPSGRCEREVYGGAPRHSPFPPKLFGACEFKGLPSERSKDPRDSETDHDIHLEHPSNILLSQDARYQIYGRTQECFKTDPRTNSRGRVLQSARIQWDRFCHSTDVLPVVIWIRLEARRLWARGVQPRALLRLKASPSLPRTSHHRPLQCK